MRAWAVAVLGLAVACGAVAAWGHRWRSPWSGGAADRRVTIELSVFGMPWENRLYTEEYIPAFERENPGIRVKFLHLEDYLNRLLLCHAGGIAPDVMRQNTSWGGLNLILLRLQGETSDAGSGAHSSSSLWTNERSPTGEVGDHQCADQRHGGVGQKTRLPDRRSLFGSERS